ncbi:unnamed protein product [Larinioides sclopetarius]|uniref:Uncharacterized protein n=1 Tax=Larinioides sclopetarius TaxID=280406 RepID=A0AAV2AL82_9ARAC
MKKFHKRKMDRQSRRKQAMIKAVAEIVYKSISQMLATQ